MKNTQTLTCFEKKYSFPILDLLNVHVEVKDNPYCLNLNELFAMAARINKKRSFLFVSKLIGKHLPIHPNKGLLTSALLAAQYYESVTNTEFEGKASLLAGFLNPETAIWEEIAFIPNELEPIIIGFAETATALGHAFFDCFHKADFFHTTREVVEERNPVLAFEEEHSHATSHRCYIPLEMIRNEREIILVDDELTTGKTALNIIRSLHAQYPRKKYTIATILDWRSQESRQEFNKLEKELGICIHVISLLAGTLHVEVLKTAIEERDGKRPKLEPSAPVERIMLGQFFQKQSYTDEKEEGNLKCSKYIRETGRFGLRSKEAAEIQRIVETSANYLAEKRTGGRTLCLGTGEFMYLPMRIASKIGSNVWFQSTTRSPIFAENQEGYGARYKASFPNPEDPKIAHYVYNIPPGFYDELIVFFEHEVDFPSLEPFIKEMEGNGFQSIKLVFFQQTEVRT